MAWWTVLLVSLLPFALFISCGTAESQLEWFSIGGTLYGVNAKKVNWQEAFLLCASDGSDLASFDSSQEMKEAEAFLKEKYGKKRYFWSSAVNIFDGKTWVFMSSGQKATDLNWCPGEPNNFENSEACSLLKTDSGCWNDAVCAENHHDQDHYALCKRRFPYDYSIFTTVKGWVVNLFQRLHFV
uniref:C-type lectin n=1 Tax=Hemiscolopendra marginata TaxID=943146 RepID=A0A646QEF8_9MYRI